MMTQAKRNEGPQPLIGEELWTLFRMHADFCKVVSTERRLAIMWLLGQGEMSVSELAEAMETSIHNVSQHLRVMKERGVVRGEKRGQSVFYSLSNPKFVQGCMLIREALIEQLQTREALVQGFTTALTRESAGPTGEDRPPA